MKYLSEITGKQYDTIEACETAEKEYLEEKAAAEKAAEEKANARKERAAEVNEAYKAVQEANQKYIELRNKFIADYGNYHQTFSKKEVFNSFDDLAKFLFNGLL